MVAAALTSAATAQDIDLANQTNGSDPQFLYFIEHCMARSLSLLFKTVAKYLLAKGIV